MIKDKEQLSTEAAYMSHWRSCRKERSSVYSCVGWSAFIGRRFKFSCRLSSCTSHCSYTVCEELSWILEFPSQWYTVIWSWLMNEEHLFKAATCTKLRHERMPSCRVRSSSFRHVLLFIKLMTPTLSLSLNDHLGSHGKIRSNIIQVLINTC